MIMSNIAITEVGSPNEPQPARARTSGQVQGHGRGGRGRGGLWRSVVRDPKFEGRCEGLKGHIFDYGDGRQAGIYMKTKRELGEYVGTAYADGAELRVAIDTLQPIQVTEPVDPPDGANAVVMKKWETVTIYTSRK